jgi:hypothetical protein
VFDIHGLSVSASLGAILAVPGILFSIFGLILAEGPVHWLLYLFGGGALLGGIWGASKLLSPDEEAARKADLARPLKRVLIQPADLRERLRFIDTYSTEPDDVDVTVFAPNTAPPQDSVIVQVFVHQIDRGSEVERRALKVDPEAHALASVPLSLPVHRGDKIKVSLCGDGLSISDPVQQGIWNGGLICFPWKHEVPLTKLMHAVIAAQPHEARSTAHLRLGEDRRCDQRVWTKLVAGLQNDAGVAFTPHDLRRTCRTLMSRLGVVTEIAALAIGHQAPRPSAIVFLVILRITYH